MKRILGVLSLVACLASAAPAAAGEDIAGARDHPLLTRYPESFITEYTQNYNASEYQVGASGSPPRIETVEGDTTTLRYFYNSVETQPSPLQLLRNYQNAIRQIGGTVVYERLPSEGDGGETTLNVSSGGKDVWIKVTPDIFGAPTQSYQLLISERAAMTQVVSANELLDALNKDGFIALYINFDTGKADLEQDAMAAVNEIATLMKSHPGLELSVEGHTDNAGDAVSNQRLSQARARSVMNAIIAAGIVAERLSSTGFGQDKPIADNRSEEGRGKNRRVELVKKS